MNKILRENTGNLIKEFEHEGSQYYLCDINEQQYKLMLLRGSVVGVDDVTEEYIVLINLMNRMFDENYTIEDMNNILGEDFVKYRNEVFNEAYEFLKDKSGNVGLKAGIIFLKNKI